MWGAIGDVMRRVDEALEETVFEYEQDKATEGGPISSEDELEVRFTVTRHTEREREREGGDCTDTHNSHSLLTLPHTLTFHTHCVISIVFSLLSYLFV